VVENKMKLDMSKPIFEIISKCRICDSEDIVLVVDLGDQPPANSLRDRIDDELPLIPLSLCRCSNCSTLQLMHTVAPSYLFSNYVWVTGSSLTAQEYSISFCEETLSRCRENSTFVLEVASNDGTFLKQFKNRGLKVLGVDPAKNIAKIAEKEDVSTLVEFFGLEGAEQIVDEYGFADCVYARNVIAHVENVHSVIDGMAKVLKDDGVGVIEFHYAKIIFDQLHYDSIYHEHLFYYSLQSACFLLRAHGLNPFDVMSSPINGGGMVLYFSKDNRDCSELLESELQKEEAGIGEAQAWVDFGRDCVSHKNDLVRLVETVVDQGGLMIGYGASARSSTLLNFCGIDNRYLTCIADGNDIKHGKFTAGTDIPIVHPKKAFAMKPEIVLLLAWNYGKEILQIMADNYGFRGKVILPLPNKPEIIEL
jgi:SAM-dependent methyltransferase